MTERKVERTVKILIEFDEWEVRELRGIFEADLYAETSRRYRNLFESALDEVQG